MNTIGIAALDALAAKIALPLPVAVCKNVRRLWDAFYPTAGASPASRHYAVGGTVYFVTPQLDMRAGVGLNHHANDFLAGVGFAARY